MKWQEREQGLPYQELVYLTYLTWLKSCRVEEPVEMWTTPGNLECSVDGIVSIWQMDAVSVLRRKETIRF